jgi:enamine deaminase RidA (YjgF/YER057c/UK114 family)
MSYERKFLDLGHEIPPVAPSVPDGYDFVLYKQIGEILYVSGYGPFWGADIPDEYTGKVGRTLTAIQGYNAARLTAINLLLIVRQAIGSLDNVVQIISVEGLVNCSDDFTDQPSVINGCSDLLVSIFGDQGRHTRIASGANALALDLCVEIKLMLQVRI